MSSNRPRSIYYSGSGFQPHRLNGTRPITRLKDREQTNYVSLTEWCSKNFISKKVGRTLIAKKLLIGQKKAGKWIVCANLSCLDQLLDYLGLEALYFDADNSP